jgi:hypothetical protein
LTEFSVVMRGLDPRIHLLAKMMDCRAFAAPKGLRPRRAGQGGEDSK